jgi:predicted membrane channel-forming protein YqfA (hemolysin III family)
MNRKQILKNLIMLFGTILLVLTAFEYLTFAYSVTLAPALAYWFQVFYLLSIFVFLVLLVIYLNPESPKKDMS